MINLLAGAQNASSAMQAERLRMEVIGQNIANANTTRTQDGQPYRRELVKFETIFQDKLGSDSETVPQTVKVGKIVKDPRPFDKVYNPSHPDADASGMVAMPNVNIHEEMADYIASSRTYEANLAVIKHSRTIAMQTLQIGHH